MIEKEKAWILKEKYNGVDCESYQKDICHLQNGEPVDYIIGSKDFLGCKINLEYRPLIPRAETEFWIDKTITDIESSTSRNLVKILDLFSGSGCIGIALLKHIPESEVTFGEIEQKSILQIRKNLNLNSLIDNSRYSVVLSDMFENISTSFHYIFANPPYISENDIEEVQTSVLKYEPKAALFADEDGLLFIKKLLLEAPEYLLPDGQLFIEIGSAQKVDLDNFLRTCLPSVYKEFHFEEDQYGRTRVLKAQI